MKKKLGIALLLALFASLSLGRPLFAADSDGDGMPDEWENLYPCLNPSVDDALLDGDTDGLENIHEYYNDMSLDGNSSDPCDKAKPKKGLPGGGYFGDSDGDLVIGTPDLGQINLELNGRHPSYARVFPPDKIVQDLDGDLVIGTPDKGIISIILNGRQGDFVSGSPDTLVLEPPLPTTVLQGDTVRIKVKLTKDGDKQRLGFGVVFTIVSGSGTLLGGEGASGGGRWDLTALDGVAQMVVQAIGADTLSVHVELPYDAEVHTRNVILSPEPDVKIQVIADTDLDGLPDDWELSYPACMQANTVDNQEDYDGDTLNNETEYGLDSNPCNADTDGDTMPDGWENNYAACVNILVGDSLADGDGDSLSNLAEYGLTSNPCNADTDGDTMLDGWEAGYSACVNLLVGDSLADGDGDTLSNLEEYWLGSNPCNADTDSDGMPDGWEVQYSSICGLNLLVNDAGADPDGDDYTNLQEYQQATDPCVFTDITPPEITIVEPQDGMTTISTINIHITYSDVGQGVDTTSLKVYHNDMELTLTVGDTNATGSVTGVSEGGNLIRAYIEDLADNSSEDTALVVIESGLPPIVNIVSPFDGESVGTEPYYRIEYYDPGSSGVDPGTLVILLDGRTVTQHFEVYDTFAEWWSTFEDTLTPSPPPHTLEAWVEDYFGKISNYEFIIFTAYAGGTQPMIDTISPDFTIAGDVVTLSGGAFGNTVEVYFSGTQGRPVPAEVVSAGFGLIEAVVPGSAISGDVYMEKKVNNRRYTSNKVSFRLGLPFAYITNRGSHRVSVYNYMDDNFPATFYPGDTTSSPMPYQADVTPDGHWLLVANRATTRVAVIDTLTNTIKKMVSLSCKTPYPTNPESLVISPDGSRAFVGSYYKVISVIDIRKALDPDLTGTTLCQEAVTNEPFSDGTSRFADLDISPDGKTLLIVTNGTGANGRTLSVDIGRYYLTDDNSNALYLDHSYFPSGSGVANANIGPFGVSFLPQPDPSNLVNPWRSLVSNYGTGTDLNEDGLVLRVLYDVAPVPDLSYEDIIDVYSGSWPHPNCQNCIDVAVSPLGDRAFLGCWYSNNLCMLDYTTVYNQNEVRAATKVDGGAGGGIREVAWTPYGNKVLAAVGFTSMAASKLMILDSDSVLDGTTGTINQNYYGTITGNTGNQIYYPEGIGVWPHFDRDGDKISDLVESNNASYTFYINGDEVHLNPTIAESDTILAKLGRAGGISLQGWLTNGIQLPEEGIGYRHFYGTNYDFNHADKDNWGSLRLVKIIEAVGREWYLRHPEGPRISIGDISRRPGCIFGRWENGVWIKEHDTHQQGLDADVRYVRNDGSEGELDLNDPEDLLLYSDTATQELVNLFCAAGVKTFYADTAEGHSNLTAPAGCTLSQPTPHSNHFHIGVR